MHDVGLQQIAKAFADNIRSLYRLALLPQYLLTYATVRFEQEERPIAPDIASAQERAKMYLRQRSVTPDDAESLTAIRRAVLVGVWNAFDSLSNDALDIFRPRGEKESAPRGLKSIAAAFYKAKALSARTDDLKLILERESLVELSELRHLLLHRGGVVDRKFTENVKWATDIIGTRVRLDGSRVQQLADPSIAAAIDLLLLLDKEKG